jgi:hypothetical protein
MVMKATLSIRDDENHFSAIHIGIFNFFGIGGRGIFAKRAGSPV